MGYTKAMRERAKKEGKPLFTVEIDRRHCKSLPDDWRGMISLQGPATPEADWAVTRLILHLSHVPEADINKLIEERMAAEGSRVATDAGEKGVDEVFKRESHG